jgi:hypothetical protein
MKGVGTEDEKQQGQGHKQKERPQALGTLAAAAGHAWLVHDVLIELCELLVPTWDRSKDGMHFTRHVQPWHRIG